MHRRTIGFPIYNFPVKGIQSSFVNLLSTLNDYKDYDLRANYVSSVCSLGSAVSAKTVKAATRITRDSVITRNREKQGVVCVSSFSTFPFPPSSFASADLYLDTLPKIFVSP